MLTATLLGLCLYFLSLLPSSAPYDLVRDYSGTTFFDRWDFYGSWDNLTLGVLARISISLPAPSPLPGDVWWLDRASSFHDNLAYVNQDNRVIIKVDNVTDLPFNEKRNSVIHLYCIGLIHIQRYYIRFESRRKTSMRLEASGL